MTDILKRLQAHDETPLQAEIDLLRLGIAQKDAEIKQLKVRVQDLVSSEGHYKHRAEEAWDRIYNLKAALRVFMADD